MDEKRQQELRSLPVAEQAAAWCLELEGAEPSGRARRAFVDWIKESPTHIEEFLQISALHLAIAESPEKVASIESLTALASRAIGTVVEWDGGADRPDTVAHSRSRRWWAGAGAAAAIGIAVVLLGVLSLTNEPAQRYQTALGEQRSIVLADDSMVVLNSNSSVTIEYSNAERHASLHSGEALFDVSRNPDRPFTVDAGNLAIRVAGTTFNVYRQTDQTVVTVVEGEVHVDADAGGDVAALAPATDTGARGGPREPMQLFAGHQVTVATTGSVAHEARANLERATAWTERRLVFDNEPLSAVVDEFNRYNRRALVLDAPALASREITGVFDARDTETLLGFVKGQPGVRIIRDADQIRIVATQ